MARLIPTPTIIQAHGMPPKQIEEYIGAVNSGTSAVSISRMLGPAGWSEPGQTSQFDEYTVVLSGAVLVETKDGTTEVAAGQAIITPAGEWVRYATPNGPAEYISVCLPRVYSRLGAPGRLAVAEQDRQLTKRRGSVLISRSCPRCNIGSNSAITRPVPVADGAMTP